ncbi:hypothetical protein FHX06_000467 [Rhizobium sp. BK512]|uniref:hypothetical protein n=1 Tax=Rhizobium sp. BK512 TaxID=2587010 RepID=UPI00160A716D|nr:hypothetical protein [Rhizobium sp. BK512]MBB3559170.1 hypothetical protein [Rhizobium sp. BK512]
MPKLILARRNLLAGMGVALAAGPAATLAASPAMANQGNMDAAMRALENALAALRRATPNKGGHKERAVGLIEQAMAEVQAGIAYAAEHGGG